MASSIDRQDRPDRRGHMGRRRRPGGEYGRCCVVGSDLAVVTRSLTSELEASPDRGYVVTPHRIVIIAFAGE